MTHSIDRGNGNLRAYPVTQSMQHSSVFRNNLMKRLKLKIGWLVPPLNLFKAKQTGKMMSHVTCSRHTLIGHVVLCVTVL